MKAILLMLVLIGAPFLIQSVFASQYNGTCPNNHGGMINDTGGFSCVTSTYDNMTAGVYINMTEPCKNSTTNITDCANQQ